MKFGILNPCLHCSDRRAGCHGVCERYKGYRSHMQDWRAAMRNWARDDEKHAAPPTDTSFQTDDFLVAALRQTYGKEGGIA